MDLLLAAIPPWSFYAALVTALAAPIATYLISQRKISGRVGTSEAAQLWDESQSIRKALREEVSGLRQEVAELRDKVDAANARERDCLERLAVVMASVEAAVPPRPRPAPTPDPSPSPSPRQRRRNDGTPSQA